MSNKIKFKLNGIFTASIIGIAFAVFVIWFFLLKNLTSAILNTISILIVSFPLTLRFSTSSAVITAVGKAFERGILIRNNDGFKRLGSSNTVILNKTGTLTNLTPVLTDTITIGTLGKTESIKIAAIAEKESEHPLGITLYQHAKEQLGELPFPEKFESIPGRGIKATVGGRNVVIGTPKLLEELGILLYNCTTQLSSLENTGKTAIILAVSGTVETIFGFSYEIKDDSEQVVSTLTSMGFEIFMITGESKKTAQYIGEKTGLKNIIAEVLPQDKDYWINQIKNEGRKIVIVGDIVYSHASLTDHDVSISINSNIKDDKSDIVFANENLSSIITTIRLSQATTAKIKQNLYLSYLSSIISIPLAIVGIITPLLAGAVLLLTAVFMVLNSLALKNFK